MVWRALLVTPVIRKPPQHSVATCSAGLQLVTANFQQDCINTARMIDK